MRMDNKIWVVFALIVVLTSFSFADTITGYKVPSSVPLGEMMTATGVFTDSNGLKEGFKCSFYFLDSSGVLIKRATDQYTTSTGRFTALNLYANEPLFIRGNTYDLRSECGQAVADANFSIGQRRTIADQAAQEFEFITNPENVDTLFIWLILGGTIIFIILILMFLYNKARGK